uniref:Uncharacterized protein n=1 Tax=Panagrolaimus davidi TaxID=227884 RepID=A0A914R0D8_9BILA
MNINSCGNSLKDLLRIAATFKSSDFKVSDKYDKKKKLEAAGFSLHTLTINDKSEKEAKMKWKKDSLSNANSSTLSLHISAYENTKEITKFYTFDGENVELKMNKTNLDKQLFPCLMIHNPFEFPRQQENDKITEPEVAEFRASQRLLRSNQSISSNNVRIPTAVASSPM